MTLWICKNKQSGEVVYCDEQKAMDLDQRLWDKETWDAPDPDFDVYEGMVEYCPRYGEVMVGIRIATLTRWEDLVGVHPFQIAGR